MCFKNYNLSGTLLPILTDELNRCRVIKYEIKIYFNLNLFFRYSGEACSLKRNDKEGNSWHWLSHTESGMTKRAAHSAIYVNHTDSLYVFGGYDLNRVLSVLEVYK